MIFFADLRIEPARSLLALLGCVYLVTLVTDAMRALWRSVRNARAKVGRIEIDP